MNNITKLNIAPGIETPSYEIVEKQFLHIKEDGFILQCGKKLEDITIAYETFGKLNTKKNNAILIVHALTGDSHAAGVYDKNDEKPGWWDVMVGPGKAIDTDIYFVVCSNILGGCMGSTGPTSIIPGGINSYNMDFPMVTIPDMVRVQKRLI
ncbi:MAG: homoserine O-acetyltransferase, partial [Desulfobacteraceae bacterium]|nr:homoserine O-acetyltransferase [Desulfobacteraceae bacterium]